MTLNQVRDLPLTVKISALLARQQVLISYQIPVLMLLALIWYRQFYFTHYVFNLTFWLFVGLIAVFYIVLRFGSVGVDLMQLLNQGAIIAGECTAIDAVDNKKRSRCLTFIYEVKGRRYQTQITTHHWKRFEIDSEYLVLYDLDDPYHAIVPLTFSKRLHNYLLEDVKIV